MACLVEEVCFFFLPVYSNIMQRMGGNEVAKTPLLGSLTSVGGCPEAFGFKDCVSSVALSRTSFPAPTTVCNLRCIKIVSDELSSTVQNKF